MVWKHEKLLSPSVKLRWHIHTASNGVFRQNNISKFYFLDKFVERYAGHSILSTGSPLNLFPQSRHTHSYITTSLKALILISFLALPIFYTLLFRFRFSRHMSCFSNDFENDTLALKLTYHQSLKSVATASLISHILTRRKPGRPCPLQIISTKLPCHIYNLACKIKTFHLP